MTKRSSEDLDLCPDAEPDLPKKGRDTPKSDSCVSTPRIKNKMAHEGIDTNLYSRQIGALGFETMGKLVKMRVLVSGMGGLGVETAKNLILAGPKKVGIHDDRKCEIRHCGSNFCITSEDVKEGKSLSEASYQGLAVLNQYVQVVTEKGELTPQILSKYDLVVLQNLSRTKAIELNEFCRNQTPAIGFIMTDAFGVGGAIFVDFGKHFICVDKDGEEPKTAVIAAITQSETGTVYIHPDRHMMPFETDDYISFKEVETKNDGSLLSENPRKIKVLTKESFSIGDTTNMATYVRGGIATQVKMPVRLPMRSLADSLKAPLPESGGMMITPDLGKLGRPEQLHYIYCALLDYREKNGKNPMVGDESGVEECLETANYYLNESKKIEKENKSVIIVEEIDEKLLKCIIYFASCELTGMTAFLGGIVAQEVVKFTGKYTPMLSPFYFDSIELLSNKWEENNYMNIEENRYYDTQVILGFEVYNKFRSRHIFLAGAGALGCEFLKAFALLGIGTKEGSITVTDMDSIEISNLNRQFLFRMEHVGHSKAKISAEAALKINSDLNIYSKEDRIGPDTEDIYDDAFWKSLDVVVNALDNIQTRQYVDSRCVWFNKPLMECGTLGPKGNVQVILPSKTQSYGDSQDPPEDSIPLCTLKHFPHQIEHTIEWARDLFQGLFTAAPEDCNIFIDNPAAYLSKLDAEGVPSVQRDRLSKIKDYLMKKDPKFSDCVERACKLFHEYFFIQISQLLHSFPVDFITAEGRPFWIGFKRPPSPITLDIVDDASHLEFVTSAANLFASILGIPRCTDRNTIIGYSLKAVLPDLVLKRMNIKVEESDDEVEGFNDDETEKAKLEEEVTGYVENGHTPTLEAITFEKDDDTNFHISFMTSCANLRARNYKIEECSFHKCKMIAGKIIPAVATTTAMVTGLVVLELMKTLTDYTERPIEDFKNAFINLALPLWVISEPSPPIKTTSKDYDPVSLGPVIARPPGFSSWDKCDIKIPNGTISQLVDAIEDKFDCEVSILSMGNTCIYNALSPTQRKNRLNQNIKTLYETITKTTIHPLVEALAVEASCQDKKEGTDVLIPTIKLFIHT